jgi:hypothetical protein
MNSILAFALLVAGASAAYKGVYFGGQYSGEFWICHIILDFC